MFSRILQPLQLGLHPAVRDEALSSCGLWSCVGVLQDLTHEHLQGAIFP